MDTFEKYKNLLSDYEIPIDNNKLWNNIKHEVPKRKRRYVLLVWLWFASMGVVSFITFFLTKAYIHSDASSHLTNTNAQPITEIKSKAIDQTKNKSNHRGDTRTNDKVGKELKAFNQSNVDYGIHLQRKQIEMKEISPFPVKIYNGKVEDKGDEQEKLIIEDVNNNFTGNLEENFNKIDDISVPYLLTTIPYIDQETKSVDGANFTPIKIPKKMHQTLLLRTSVGKVKTTHTSTNANDNYSRLLNNSEKGLEFINAELLIGIFQKKYFSIYSGLQYNRATSRISHAARTLHVIPITHSQIIHIDRQGQSISSFDNGSGYSSELSKYTWHTVYQNLNWITDFQLHLDVTKRLGLTLTGSPIFCITARQNGGIMNEEEKLYKFDNTNSPYTSKVFQWSYGGYFKYQLNTNIDFYTGCQMFYQTFNIKSLNLTKNLRSTTFSLSMASKF